MDDDELVAVYIPVTCLSPGNVACPPWMSYVIRDGRQSECTKCGVPVVYVARIKGWLQTVAPGEAGITCTHDAGTWRDRPPLF